MASTHIGIRNKLRVVPRLGLNPYLISGSSLLPPPPTGFVYLKGADGKYLKGADGKYLLGPA